MSKDISVIIPYYKMEAYLQSALNSILKQHLIPKEVIIINDASPCGCINKILKENTNIKIKYIVNLHRKGVSSSRNIGIKQASGDIIAFLDADDWWTEDHLQKSLEKFEQDPFIDIVAGPITNYSEKTKEFVPWQFSDWMIQRFPASLTACNFIQPSAALVKTAILRKISGFDTSKELNHIEDYDLWIRLVQAGAKFGFRKEITCFYRRHDEAASADREKMELLHRNLVAKHRDFFLNAQRELIADLMHRSVNLHYLNRSPLFQVYVYLFKSLKKTKDNILKFLNG